MNKVHVAKPYVFIDILPRSLYRSLVEIQIRIQNNLGKENFSITFPNKFKVLKIESNDEIRILGSEKENVATIYFSKSWSSATFIIGIVSLDSAGGVSEDSGWELYPLMSNELKLDFSISPYEYLALRLVTPENCHLYSNKLFSYMQINDGVSLRTYHYPEKYDPASGDINLFRLKSSFDGYPITRSVPFIFDHNCTGKRVELKLQAYFREAFIFHLISVFTPILYGIPVIALWAYSNQGFDASKKIPIMIAIIPFYIGLWYKSNIMKSVPTVTNFLTFLYIFLYALFVCYAFILSYWTSISTYLFLFYALIGLLVFIIVSVFCVTPMQHSKFLGIIKRILKFVLKPLQIFFQYS